MRKRILALLLALVMCLSLLPTAAFAEAVTDIDGTTSASTDGDAVGGNGVDDSDDETTDTNDTTDTTDTSDTTDTTDTTDDEDAPVPVVQSAAPLLGTASTPVVLASTGMHTNHKSCGSASCTGGGHDCSATTWDAWTETNSLPTGGGSYYLTGNVTISSTWKPSSTTYHKTTTNLCLNGYTITYTGTTASPAIEIQSGGKKLVLCDCKNTGKIVHNGSKGGSAVQVNGSFTMYGGTITRRENAGSGVYVDSGYFTMYGGTITGHCSIDSSITGSGVYVAPGGSFTLSGGKITGNKGTHLYSNSGDTYGGGVFVAAYPHYGNFSMSGGTIGGTGEDDGNSADYGGGVYIENHTQDAPNAFHMIMSGGTITGNSADQGGGVLVDLYGFFKMTGGTITQNVAEENGGGVYVKSDTITVGGGATIIGNKKVGLGTASGGKENNVYLPSESVYITVNSGFTGAVGLNVDGEYWGTTPPGGATNFGANWVTVKGDGSSNAVKNNKVTYDDGDFTINSNGKLKCLHACGVVFSPDFPHVCERCGEWIIIKTEFKNAAGNTLKTQYYADAATAFDKAEDNCVITMLTAAEFKSYTWTLDGKTVTLYADYTLEGLTVEGGTLNLRYTRDITIPYIHSMVVGAGATVNVDVYPSGFTDSSSLTVKSGGKVVFKSGNVDELKVESGGEMEISGEIVRDGIYKDKLKSTFDNIHVENGTCADLLVDGYAFFDQTNQTIVNGNTKDLTNVTVDKHTCDFNDHPICACGRGCPHSSIDFATGKCNTCQVPMTGILVQKTAGGTPVTGKFTTFNAAMDSIQPGDTNVTIKLMQNAEFVDTDPAAEDDNTTILFPCTIDLNGKKLTVKEKSGDHTEESNLIIASTVTITGTDTTIAGTIDTGVSVYVSKADNVAGKLTVTGNVSIPRLWVNKGAVVKLKGGTYGNVSGSCTAGDLLAEGYAFQKTDSSGDFAQYSTNISPSSGTSLTNVKVVECKSHSIGTGGKCNWCGTQFAVARTIGTTTAYFATLSDAINSDIKDFDTVTIKLLADVTEKNGEANKQIEIEKNIYLTLDLNGKTLTANITVSADSTGKLTMSSSGTLAGTLTVLDGSAELSGGTFNEIKVGTGKTVRSLLKAGCGYQYTADKTWPTGDTLDGTSLANVSVKPIPITGVTVSPSGDSYPYGDTTSLTATPSGVAEGAAVSYQWYTVSGTTEAKIHDATNASYKTPADLAIGPHTFICKATVYGYTLTGNQVTVTVTKATLTEQTGTTGGGSGGSGSSGESGSGSTSTATYTAPKAKTGLTYTGEAQALMIDAGAVPTGCTMKYSLDKNTWTDNAEDIKETNASSYTVYWYIDGGTNYSDVGSETAPQLLTVTIARKTIGSGDITVTGGGYTGKPIEPTITVKVGSVTLKAGTDYTVSGATKKTDAGTYDLTITGKGNYAGTLTVKWTITRKTLTLTPNTYIVYAKKGAAPTADLAQIAKTLGMPDNDGALTFYDSDEQPISALPAADATTTLTLTVRSKNHQATIQIEIVISDKIVPAVSVSDYNKPYSGAEVAPDDIQKTVTTEGVTGTWTWTNEGTAPTNVADSGYYSLTFTPTDDDYSAVTTTVQVTITRKTVTLSNLAAQKVYDGTAAVNENTTLSLSPSDSLVLGADYTITASFDNANAGTGKTVTATVTLSDSAAENYCFAGSGGTSVKKVTITGTNGVIAQKELTIGSASANPKYYDGTVTVSGYSVAFEGFVEDESGRPKRGTDYTLAASFDSADVDMDKTVTITVTLADTAKAANYCFKVNGSASRTITKTVKANIYRLPLDTMPTAKESVVKLRQDVSVRSGSYPLSGNVNVVLPEGVTLDLSRELRFTLGTLPAKVSAQVDETTGMLTYTITGGRSGEKFAIPVTVTMPNLAYYAGQGGGAAAVALYALNDDQTPETAPDAGTITLTFTVEIELTGSATVHHPHRWNGNLTGGTAGGSGSASGSGTGTGNGSGSGVASPATGDAGIALYGVLTVLSLTGGAWLRRKKR